MAESRTIENKSASCCSKGRIHECESQKHRPAKDHDRCSEAGEKLACHQDFAAHRRQEVVVQTFLDHVSFEQPGEEPQAAEEDSERQVIELEDTGQDPRIFINV